MANFLTRWFNRRRAAAAPAASSTASPAASPAAPTPPAPPAEPPAAPAAPLPSPSAELEGGLGLDDITRGLQHAASSANDLLAQQYMRMLEQFFDWDEHTSTMRAKSVLVEMGNGHQMHVPLVTLSTPRGLFLEKMIVHLTVRNDGAQSVLVHDKHTEAKKHSANFSVSMAPRKRTGETRDSSMVDMELHFSSQSPPEAVMRIIDEYTNQILPQAKAAPAREGQNDGEAA